MILVLVFSIVNLTLLSSCTKTIEIEVPKTEYVFRIPEKVTVPTKPIYQKYNPKEPVNSVQNFKKLQINWTLTVEYIAALKRTILYYEKQIDNMLMEQEAAQNAH